MDKKVIVVLVVVAVIGAAAYVVLTKKDPAVKDKAGAHPFPALKVTPPQDAKERRAWMSPLKKKIDGIELTRGDKTVVLQRTEKPKTPRDVGKWELVKPVKYAANERQIRQLFTRLERLEFWELLTQNKGDFDDLHVTDSKGVRVRLMEGDKVLADMVVGKTIRTEISGQNQTYTAVRKTGTDKVWKLVGSLTHLFDKPLNRWRDATILKETRDRIAALVIRDSNGNFLAAQRDPDETDRKKKRTNWELVQSNPDIQELDTSDIGRLASSLSRLRTKEFADGKKLADAGLDKPHRRIFAIFKKGSAKKPAPRKKGEPRKDKPVAEKEKKDKPAKSEGTEKSQDGASAVGGTTPTGIAKIDALAKDPNYEVHEILLGKEQPKAKTRYVKQAKNPQVFSVPTRSLKNLEKKVLDFKDKTVIRIDAKKLTRIEVQHPKGKTVLVRKEEAPKKDAKKDKKKADKKAKPKMVWTVEEPKVLKLDTAGVDRVARMLEKRFRARSYAETTEPEKTGLDKPEGRVLLTVEGERRPVELLVGKEKDKRKRFLQVKGKPEVYLMGPHPLGQIYKEPEKWKKRKRPQGMGRGGRRRMPPGMMRRMRRRRR